MGSVRGLDWYIQQMGVNALLLIAAVDVVSFGLGATFFKWFLAIPIFINTAIKIGSYAESVGKLT